MDNSKAQSTSQIVSNILITFLLVVLFGLQIFFRDYVTAAFILFFIVIAIFRISKAPVDLIGRMPALVVFLVITAFWTYRSYGKYRTATEIAAWQEKFGPAYNNVRAKNGVPVIPGGWEPKYRSEDFVNWKDKANGIGHTQKRVHFNELHSIRLESDLYNLKPDKAMERSVEIFTKYNKAAQPDSVFYNYEFGSNTRTITRQTADSIFNAEKIRTDY